ncbi:MAG: S-layer homology domain-containing protein, partial [Firmicutes bacterium]|nr:S-layer homology domain-containing protein [Bacillota bacterium]
MTRKFLSIFLILLLCLTLSPLTASAASAEKDSEIEKIAEGPEMAFRDVKENDWFHSAVVYMYNEGLMKGTSETNFSPDLHVTRGMMVTMLWRLEGEPICGQGKSGTFIDVPEYTWYTEAVEWAAANEIVLGHGNGTFKPEAPVTREQAAAILFRYAQHKNYDAQVEEDEIFLGQAQAEFTNAYAIPALQWTCETGIIEGSNGKL